MDNQNKPAAKDGWNDILETERFYTVAEVAERLSVNRETVRRWLRSGQLQGFQVAKKSGWRIPARSVNRMVEAMDVLGKPAAA